VTGSPVDRRVLESALGIAADRPLPPFASERFDRWFRRRRSRGTGTRGAVLLWDDTWVRYHEPEVGRAAVAVLEAAGFEVRLARGRRCCGRPAASRGLLDEARRLGEHNLALLRDGDEPIVFLEPSCWSMFVDDYRQLGLDGAQSVAERAVLFEHLLLELLRREPEALPLSERRLEVAVHAHCHADALGGSSGFAELAGRIPGVTARVLDTACCGMAGAFGMLRATERLSREVAAPLVETVRALPEETELVASGTSCRHQVEQLAGRRPRHMAELLASALVRAPTR
jgi:Fe-S oxidoreductase